MTLMAHAASSEEKNLGHERPGYLSTADGWKRIAIIGNTKAYYRYEMNKDMDK